MPLRNRCFRYYISVKGFTDEAAHHLHYGNNFFGAFYNCSLEGSGQRGKLIPWDDAGRLLSCEPKAEAMRKLLTMEWSL